MFPFWLHIKLDAAHVVLHWCLLRFLSLVPLACLWDSNKISRARDLYYMRCMSYQVRDPHNGNIHSRAKVGLQSMVWRFRAPSILEEMLTERESAYVVNYQS